jgi:predicted O-methyltransferase YrrM
MGVIERLSRARREGRLAESVLSRLAPRTVRAMLRPTVAELVLESPSLDEVLDEVAPGWREHGEEYEAIEADLAERYPRTVLKFPHHYRIEPVTLRVLYALIRVHRPALVLETGVANGHSTVVLLDALRRNGTGLLHSVDVIPDPGPLLNDSERARWNFHRINPATGRRDFTALTAALGPIGLFFHDSDHRYRWQLFEYETALAGLTPDGAIVSDDVDYSYAFLDFCRARGLKARFLFDKWKVIGYCRRSEPPS